MLFKKKDLCSIKTTTNKGNEHNKGTAHNILLTPPQFVLLANNYAILRDPTRDAISKRDEPSSGES